ncbi:FmdB family zinc ribbon protein [Nitrosococcus watsonii]|uniref:Regulatory protein, FmdB family n=1 Tax=Nitrosococcus watsoni (strain C-113) TaxID=105559 RepID=D8K9S5_NITWC|nr:zinc ribbon domain-containing protein [Nitrosococcus watsonii]ADJ27364.1 regulatory protein, FmdB family [Nitrosococcus watsonii C-113]
MPIYEYRCQACGHKMELLQKITEEPLLRCPSCGKEQLRKLVSAAGFRFKGGGWYETDFKSGNKRNLAASSDDSKESSNKKEGPSQGKDKQEKTSGTDSKSTGDAAATG